MDESRIIDALRAGADGIGTEDSDVDALVRDALVQGRRRRTRRRVGAALGTVMAAAVVVTVVATGVVPTLLGTPQPGPVATPLIATPAPSTARPSATAAPATTGLLSGTPAQVQATLVRLMPASATVTRAVSDSGKVVEGREHNAYLDLRDAKGTSNVSAGVGEGRYSDVCATNENCRKVSVAGGTLWTMGGPSTDKAGLDQSAYFNRPDGGRLWLTQSNYDEGNGPVTREGLPLSTKQVTALLTDPAWDRYFRG